MDFAEDRRQPEVLREYGVLEVGCESASEAALMEEHDPHSGHQVEQKVADVMEGTLVLMVLEVVIQEAVEVVGQKGLEEKMDVTECCLASEVGNWCLRGGHIVLKTGNSSGQEKDCGGREWVFVVDSYGLAVHNGGRCVVRRSRDHCACFSLLPDGSCHTQGHDQSRTSYGHGHGPSRGRVHRSAKGSCHCANNLSICGRLGLGLGLGSVSLREDCDDEAMVCSDHAFALGGLPWAH